MAEVGKIRVGVIGAGAFAQACHIPGLQSHPKAEIVALWSRQPDVARNTAEQFGIPAVHNDFRELCRREDINAITIATPNIAHRDQALEALRNHKHLFCEKPLSVNLSDATKMTEAAKNSGRVHQVAFTFRYNYGLRELKRRVQAGDIGEPFYARIQYDSWDGLKPDWQIGWREKQEVAGGGLLFDVGSHLFDILRHVVGPVDETVGFTHHIPRTASDRSSTEQTAVETDDLANVWSRHVNEVRSQFFVSRITPPFAPIGYLEVIGREGALKAALSRGGVDFLKVSRPTSSEWQDLPLPAEASDKQPHALGNMMRSFVDACLRGKIDPDLDASFEDGLAAQAAIDAVLRSQAEHCWCRVKF